MKLKKKIRIPIVSAVILLAVLFMPIPSGVYKDGGTREYKALTYRIVNWNRLTADNVYEKTSVYFGADCFKSIDELWEQEAETIVPSKDFRQKNYTGDWLDREAAEKYTDPESEDLVITEIYADCFFARYVVPMPYTVKINGTLPAEWCVGDQVRVTYANRHFDGRDKWEGDLQKIEASTFEIEPGVDYKPVIYLYPETETEVSVKLTLDGGLTCTYPAYKDGWTVTAAPDGTLTDEDGQTYNYLYWEGETYAEWDFSHGFCVKGEDTAAFLEKALAALGLNRREANEFIVFWLPLMQENEYNIISFQTDVYTDSAVLEVTPQADTLIRVFMAYMASDAYTEIEPQVLTAPKRTGFTVVEWGGTVVK